MATGDGKRSRLVLATHNPGKAVEVGRLLGPLGYDVVTLDELGVVEEVDEDAPTFLGNAEKKARAAHHGTGLSVLADDSGLEVDALAGAPGVRSARYAEGARAVGQDLPRDVANNQKLLAELAGVPTSQRTARFRCALVLINRAGRTLHSEGLCEGRILHAPRGSGGFGYDPLFEVCELGRTLAELGADEKNRVSHRGRALRQLMNALASGQMIL